MHNDPTVSKIDPKRVTREYWGNGVNAETPLFIKGMKKQKMFPVRVFVGEFVYSWAVLAKCFPPSDGDGKQ